MDKREPGYYWVKHRGEWVPALSEFFNGLGWVYTTIDFTGAEIDFDEIGPRIEPPEAEGE